MTNNLVAYLIDGGKDRKNLCIDIGIGIRIQVILNREDALYLKTDLDRFLSEAKS